MTVWQPTNPIDYSANGDDIDALAQKTLGTFNEIYDLLQRLRTLNAGAGTSVGDAEPFEFRIDSSTEPATIYLRGSDNQWKEMGKVADNFGFDANSFGGLQGQGGIVGIGMGLDANKPGDAPNNSLYVAYDTCKIYVRRSGMWDLLMSRDFDDMTDTQNTLVMKSEVSESPTAGKIPRVNNVTGELDVNISGNAAKLLNYILHVTNIQDGDVLAFDTTNQRLVNVRKDEVKAIDVSTTGEANKIVKTDGAGNAHVNITGSAGKISLYPIEMESLADGQALVYDGTNQKFRNKSVATKDEQGVVDASISGSAAKLVNVPVRLDGNLQDGQVFVYHAALGCFINEAKGTVGSGASLTLHQGEETIDYNGSQNVEATIPTTEQVQYQIEHTLATDESVGVMKLYEEAGSNTDGAVTQAAVSHAIEVAEVADLVSTLPSEYQGLPIYTCWTSGSSANKYVYCGEVSFNYDEPFLITFLEDNTAENVRLHMMSSSGDSDSAISSDELVSGVIYAVHYSMNGWIVDDALSGISVRKPTQYKNLPVWEEHLGNSNGGLFVIPAGFDLSNVFLARFVNVDNLFAGLLAQLYLYSLDDNGTKTNLWISGDIYPSESASSPLSKLSDLTEDTVYAIKTTVNGVSSRFDIVDSWDYELCSKVLQANAVTQPTTDNSNAIATTAYVQAAIAAALANT